MGILVGNGYLPLVADLATYSITPKNGDGLIIGDLGNRQLTWKPGVSVFAPPAYQQGSITPGAWLDHPPGTTQNVTAYATNATAQAEVNEIATLEIAVTAAAAGAIPQVSNLGAWPANVVFLSCEFADTSVRDQVNVTYQNESGAVQPTFNIAIEVISFS